MARETETRADDDDVSPTEDGEEMSETNSGQGDQRKPYEKPAVVTYPSAKILESLGPALAVYGDEFGGGDIAG